MRIIPYIALFIAVSAHAQSINISDFYYRDFLDFGQGKGDFSNGITKKDGTTFTIPQTPNFSASSNYGSLTSVGRGFAVTANHVSSPESISDLRKWGLTGYNIATENGISSAYGADTKFMRFNKYIVEGQAEMLDISNSTRVNNDEATNLTQFIGELDKLKDDDGNIYLYQAGSGVVTLRKVNSDKKNETLTSFNTDDSGALKGGGFGILNTGGINYKDLVNSNCKEGEKCERGISFNYKPDSSFQNIITSGDSGSGIYAYDSKNKKWILLGVTSQTFIQLGGDEAKVSFASNKDFLDYQKNFEQKINLKISDSGQNDWTLNNTNLEYKKRGDTPDTSHTLIGNKDIIFSGGGNIEVTGNIYRNLGDYYAGGFVFTTDDSATSTNPTKYTFTNGGNYYFKGSGLDIGENVIVEWALRNESGDSLHKIGKGELIVKTDYIAKDGENLGTLKLGEGKVTLDSSKKAFENIYITSGRGELVLKKDKAEALGATKGTNGNNMNISLKIS